MWWAQFLERYAQAQQPHHHQSEVQLSQLSTPHPALGIPEPTRSLHFAAHPLFIADTSAAILQSVTSLPPSAPHQHRPQDADLAC
jgi:hypothetical protein